MPNCGEKVINSTTKSAEISDDVVKNKDNVVNTSNEVNDMTKNEKKSYVDKFKELSLLKKVCCCGGVLAVIFIIMFLVGFMGADANFTEMRELSSQYDGYDLYSDKCFAFSKSILNNDSNQIDSIKYDLAESANLAANEMYDDGMSIEDITHALNEPFS